jgi:hypothetical protein
MRCVRDQRPQDQVHDDLVRIAQAVNKHESQPRLLKQVHAFVHQLKADQIQDAIYFPDLILMNKLALSILFVFKAIWLVLGGWIWRGVRSVIFAKIKANTFKSPVSVGAAMVIYPLVTLLFAVVCLVAGWPLWLVAAWLFVMWTGVFFRPSWSLIWKLITLNGSRKQELAKDIKSFQQDLISLLSGKING